MGILQARILEWVSMPSTRGSSQPRDRTQVSCIAGRFFTIWSTRETIEGRYFSYSCTKCQLPTERERRYRMTGVRKITITKENNHKKKQFFWMNTVCKEVESTTRLQRSLTNTSSVQWPRSTATVAGHAGRTCPWCGEMRTELFCVSPSPQTTTPV